MFFQAKNIHGTQRISMFGVLAGVRSISAVCATFAARFLPIASTFQVLYKLYANKELQKETTLKQ